MKNKLHFKHFSLFIFLLFILLNSCQQYELEFSCDPEINDFIIENREELKILTVNELGAFEVPLQKAIFVSWDYKKKRSAWINKLTTILANESFSKQEKNHIQKLIDHIHLEYFKEESILTESISRHQFADEWMEYGINELGWDDQFIAYVVFRMYTNYYQFEAELSMLKSFGTIVTTDSEGSCNCNTSADFCSGALCNSNGCTTSSGCGWLWSESCNGSCY